MVNSWALGDDSFDAFALRIAMLDGNMKMSG